MHMVKRILLIILLYIMIFIIFSEAAMNNATSTLLGQSDTPSTTFYNYVPMLILFLFSLPVLYIEFIIASKSSALQMKMIAKDSDIGSNIIPRWSSQDQIRFIGLTIVVFLAVFVVTIPDKSFDNNLTAALFGFLGTVVGYLAGSKEPEKEQKTPPPTPPGGD